jgi:hypothetical protein
LRDICLPLHALLTCEAAVAIELGRRFGRRFAGCRSVELFALGFRDRS